jgi:hypothetical protein
MAPRVIASHSPPSGAAYSALSLQSTIHAALKDSVLLVVGMAQWTMRFSLVPIAATAFRGHVSQVLVLCAEK